MNGKSHKVVLTEKFVDEYTSLNGHPPTYQIIVDHFKISRCAAWNRCKKFRYKMKGVENKEEVMLVKPEVTISFTSQTAREKLLNNKDFVSAMSRMIELAYNTK